MMIGHYYQFSIISVFCNVYIFAYDLLLPKTKAKLVVQHVFIELKKTQCKWMKICLGAFRKTLIVIKIISTM
jgi:hypothetical protein